MFSEQLKRPDSKPCSFLAHAVCVSDVLEFFEVKPPGKCKPACTEFYFKPVTTQVFTIFSPLNTESFISSIFE